jgi:hypothetical protein
MGRHKNNVDKYYDLTPEKLHTHVRKNISIPKYMDLFLYENKISLSKLVQNAINNRIQETQFQLIKKEVEHNSKERSIRGQINKREKDNPNFKNELKRARLLLTQYFTSFDSSDHIGMDQKKQLILSDFPEMYVDIIRFENWYKENDNLYQSLKIQYENPVERLIAIKKEFFSIK